jgi:FkbM family methyltransferase
MKSNQFLSLVARISSNSRFRDHEGSGVDPVPAKRSTRHYERLRSICGDTIATVVDVGVGDEGSPFLYESFPTAYFYSIDPVVETLLGLERVGIAGEAIPLALSDKSSGTTLEISAKASRSTLSRRIVADEKSEGVQTREIRVTTLDELVAENVVRIQPDALLKIDVEGHELAVLHGSARTLHLFQHVMVGLTFGWQFEDQSAASEMIGFLAEHGFELTGVAKCGLDTADVVLSRGGWTHDSR